ncbi:hypothetical protein [Microbacterium sp.]|uniref:hypothetical protein n=1 Tax=Microbacterium sp. TaxID=51671 RepID=UPI002811AE60|nr:hypothetical protein [Microbacterium sp.]
MTDPRIEGPTPEVERPQGPPPMPGAPKGYGRFPTGPVSVEPVTIGPDADAEAFADSVWEPASTAEPVDDARLAPWALFAAIVALATSMFVGWGIPVAIVAVIAAIMSLRRPVESRAMAIWALVLGLAATLFSAGWLIWAAMQFEIMG